jgi:cob(I)alamin adenosyltransferase
MISTKKGDKGTSRNYSNDTLPKTDVLFETLGSIDELSSSLGVAYHYSRYQESIQSIQLKLQHIMSIIATNPDDPRRGRLVQITTEDIDALEQLEQSILEEFPLEPRFVLQGSDSSKEGAYLDMARAISRRVERQVLRFNEQYKRDDLDVVQAYLNRISDVLYIMARSTD